MLLQKGEVANANNGQDSESDVEQHGVDAAQKDSNIGARGPSRDW
jgi:hypothetical protein